MDLGDREYRSFQRQVDRICTLILFERSAAEIAAAKSHLRQEAERLFPNKLQLYERIYESRFRRLWDQFRPGESEWRNH
jgi:hypothetical protein